MATYYKYAEREADSQINWAEIGKSMSDMLAEQNRIREEKKAAIDQASQEYGEKLSNPPQGEFKAMNQWTLEYADDYQKYRLMQDKLLKSGQLKMKDYMVMRQNSLDGTDQLFNLSTQYQQVYKEKMDRSKKQENQDLELFLMQQAEGLANFVDHKAYINPTDGTVSIAKMVAGEDGVKRMSTNANEFITVAALGNSIKDNYDRFKSNEAVTSYVDGLGERITTLLDIKNKYQRGSVIEILDPMQNKDLPDDIKGIARSFEQAETDMLNSFLTTPTNVTSILTEDVNTDPINKKEYTYTWSEEEAKANSNLILLKNNSAGRPEPQLTEEQRAVALDHLRVKARLMYDRKETANVVGASETPQPRAKTEAELTREAYDKERRALMIDWQKLYSGTKAEKEAALKAIAGSPIMQTKGIERLKFSPDGNRIELEYRDPTKNRDDISLLTDTKSFFKQGTEVFETYTQEDIDKFGTGNYVGGGAGLSASIGVNYKPSLNKLADNQAWIYQGDDQDTATHLAQQFGGLGFTFIPAGDKVTIKAYNGKEDSFDITTQKDVKRMRQYIKDYADPKLAGRKFKDVAGEGDAVFGVK